MIFKDGKGVVHAPEQCVNDLLHKIIYNNNNNITFITLRKFLLNMHTEYINILNDIARYSIYMTSMQLHTILEHQFSLNRD